MGLRFPNHFYGPHHQRVPTTSVPNHYNGSHTTSSVPHHQRFPHHFFGSYTTNHGSHTTPLRFLQPSATASLVSSSCFFVNHDFMIREVPCPNFNSAIITKAILMPTMLAYTNRGKDAI